MPTIEQRWKAVGVDREEVVRVVAGDGVESKWRISYRTDDLLPLIEKAVREARKAEAHLWLGMTCNEEADARMAKLEAGND